MAVPDVPPTGAPGTLAILLLVDSSVALYNDWAFIYKVYVGPMIQRLKDAFGATHPLRLAFISYGNTSTHPRPIVQSRFFTAQQDIEKDLMNPDCPLGLGYTVAAKGGMAVLEGMVTAIEMFEALIVSMPHRPLPNQPPPSTVAAAKGILNYLFHVASSPPDGMTRPEWNLNPQLDAVSWETVPAEMRKRDINYCVVNTKAIPRFTDLHATVSAGNTQPPFFTVRSPHIVKLSGFPMSTPKPAAKRPAAPLPADQTPDAKRARPNPPPIAAAAAPAPAPTPTQPRKAPPANTTPAEASQPGPSASVPVPPAPAPAPPTAPAPGQPPRLTPHQAWIALQQMQRSTTRIKEIEALNAASPGDAGTRRDEQHKLVVEVQQFKMLFAHNQEIMGKVLQMRQAQAGQGPQGPQGTRPQGAPAAAPAGQEQPSQPSSEMLAQMMAARSAGGGGAMQPGQSPQQPARLPPQQQPVPSPAGPPGGPPGVAGLRPDLAEQMHKLLAQNNRQQSAAQPPAQPPRPPMPPVAPQAQPPQHTNPTLAGAWFGVIGWKGVDQSTNQLKELYAEVVAVPGRTHDIQPHLWPRTIQLAPSRTEQVSMQELQMWTQQIKPTPALFSLQADAKTMDKATNTANCRSLIQLLQTRNVYAIGNWPGPNGTSEERIIIFPHNKGGLAGAVFASGKMPPPPGPPATHAPPQTPAQSQGFGMPQASPPSQGMGQPSTTPSAAGGITAVMALQKLGLGPEMVERLRTMSREEQAMVLQRLTQQQRMLQQRQAMQAQQQGSSQQQQQQEPQMSQFSSPQMQQRLPPQQQQQQQQPMPQDFANAMGFNLNALQPGPGAGNNNAQFANMARFMGGSPAQGQGQGQGQIPSGPQRPAHGAVSQDMLNSFMQRSQGPK